MFGPASAGSKTAACAGRGRGPSLWEERSDRELNDEISRLISPGAADSSSRVGVSDRRPRHCWEKSRRCAPCVRNGLADSYLGSWRPKRATGTRFDQVMAATSAAWRAAASARGGCDPSAQGPVRIGCLVWPEVALDLLGCHPAAPRHLLPLPDPHHRSISLIPSRSAPSMISAVAPDASSSASCSAGP